MPTAQHAFRFIDAPTLRAWLNDGHELALLDVREAGQFGEGHPFFAVPFPFSRLELDAPRLLPRAGVRIALIDDGDEHARVARRAATRLHQLGYGDVSILEGGVDAWTRAGYTLFRGVNVPSKTFGELVEHAYGTPHVGAAQLQRWQAERGGCPIALIDGRTREEHRKMAIPGAVCVPNGELAAHIDAFAGSPDTTIVIHCAGRTRSIIGAQTLRNLGIRRDVFALENGTQGWALAGLELEHGSTRSFADNVPLWPDSHERAKARDRAQALAQRFGVNALDEHAARAWLDDTSRTTYLLDVRTPEEYARDGLPFVQHAPGGQLVQATDQSVAVRGARLLLVDHDAIRAPVIAHWLVQLGYEVATVDASAVPVRSIAPVVSGDVAGAPKPDAIVLDVRSSAAHEKARPAGSHWTTRARVFHSLLRAEVDEHAPLTLFADSQASGSLVAADLRDAGFGDVTVFALGLDAWESAGFAVDRDALRLEPSVRIDYLFFVHDRHDGNLDAARQYLAWETGLIAQCEADELAGFRVGEAAVKRPAIRTGCAV